MSLGFGFSPSDVIKALELVATVIDALRESGKANAQCRELLRQLHSLETALIQVKRLEVDESLHREVAALRQAAAQCQRTIDDFWDRIKPYQPRLCRPVRSSLGLKDKWMKVKWAVCKKDDVAEFKANLVGHTESINLLLSTIQMESIKIRDDRQRTEHRSLFRTIQDSFFDIAGKLPSLLDGLATCVQQSRQLIEIAQQVLRTNVQIFQIVLNLQNIIVRLPGQIDRQQPVYLTDAVGRTSPFHLEFIQSAEALISVLTVTFKDYGVEEKIRKGEFFLEDAVTKQDIDLQANWNHCFTPGQHVEMGMIFQRYYTSNSKCPHCHFDYNADIGQSFKW